MRFFPHQWRMGTWIWIVVTAFVVIFSIYGPSLSYKFIAWDDIGLIHKNPIVQEISVSTLKEAFTTYDPELYIPLTLISYQIDFAIGGLDPFMFHLQNIL